MNSDSTEINTPEELEKSGIYAFTDLRFESFFVDDPEVVTTQMPLGLTMTLIRDGISVVTVTESREKDLQGYYRSTGEKAKKQLRNDLIYKLKHGGMADLDRRVLRAASKNVMFRESNGLPIAYTVFKIPARRELPLDHFGYYSLGIMGLCYYCAYGIRVDYSEALSAIESFNFLP